MIGRAVPHDRFPELDAEAASYIAQMDRYMENVRTLEQQHKAAE